MGIWEQLDITSATNRILHVLNTRRFLWSSVENAFHFRVCFSTDFNSYPTAYWSNVPTTGSSGVYCLSTTLHYLGPHFYSQPLSFLLSQWFIFFVVAWISFQILRLFSSAWFQRIRAISTSLHLRILYRHPQQGCV